MGNKKHINSHIIALLLKYDLQASHKFEKITENSKAWRFRYEVNYF